MSPGWVLAIDDDADILEALDLVLGAAGHQVVTARNGVEALEILRSKDPPPFVILLDLMMPRLDGWGFRDEQRKDPRLSEVPLVVLSGDGHVRRKASSIGVEDFLSKPVDPSVLLSLVKRFAGR